MIRKLLCWLGIGHAPVLRSVDWVQLTGTGDIRRSTRNVIVCEHCGRRAG